MTLSLAGPSHTRPQSSVMHKLHWFVRYPNSNVKRASVRSCGSLCASLTANPGFDARWRHRTPICLSPTRSTNFQTLNCLTFTPLGAFVCHSLDAFPDSMRIPHSHKLKQVRTLGVAFPPTKFNSILLTNVVYNASHNDGGNEANSNEEAVINQISQCCTASEVISMICTSCQHDKNARTVQDGSYLWLLNARERSSSTHLSQLWGFSEFRSV